MTTLNGTVLEANRDATRLFGITLDELVGSPIARWIPPVHRSVVRDALAAAGAGQTLRGADADSVLLLVDDEGPGVPPELREQLFLPFMQTLDDQEHGASGLGLAIVAMFAAMHGGRAWVEEAAGGGSGFRVELANAAPES